MARFSEGVGGGGPGSSGGIGSGTGEEIDTGDDEQEFDEPDRENVGGDEPTAGTSGDAGGDPMGEDDDDFDFSGDRTQDMGESDFAAPRRRNLGDDPTTAGAAGDAGVSDAEDVSDTDSTGDKLDDSASSVGGTVGQEFGGGVRQQQFGAGVTSTPVQSARRGVDIRTAKNEPTRNAVATALGVAFQRPKEVAPFVGISPERARRRDVTLTGPTVTLREGQRGDLDTDITDQLTEGRGLLTEQQEREIRRDVRQRQEFFGVGEETGALVEDVTGSETAGDFATGLGRLPGSAAAAPGGLALAIDTGTEVATNLPETVSEEGAAPVAAAGGEVAGRVLRGTTQEAKENPAEFAGEITGEIALGTAATRAGVAAGSRVRSARVRRRADAEVDLEDITTERGAEGDLPQFETDPSAPTGEAVEEVRERAADQPEDVTEAVGTERTLFQSTEADLGPEFEARRGRSELPGLFTSPDASPLRLSEGQTASLASLRPRLPRRSDFTGRSDRFAAFEGDRIEAMPPSATGFGRRRTDTGDFEPDPSTSGAQFLEQDAPEGTAFVRPPGSRTTELEAIFPPGSEFRQTGELAVNLPSGRAVPLDVFERRNVPDVDADIDISDADDVTTSEAIAMELRSRSMQDREGTPIAPPIGTPPMNTSATTPPGMSEPFSMTPPAGPNVTDPPATDDMTSPFSGLDTPRPTPSPVLTPRSSAASPSGTPAGTGASGASGGGSSTAGSPPPGGSGGVSSGSDPTSTPASPPSSGGGGPASTPTSPPGSSPGGPPSSPPSSTPGAPGSPPMAPPSSPPVTPGSPPTTPPEAIDLDVDDDDDDKFGLFVGGEQSKRFTTPVATPESVLSSEGPGDVGFTDRSVETVDPGSGPDITSVEGDPSAATPEQRRILEDSDSDF